jgi:hypothetical protein
MISRNGFNWITYGVLENAWNSICWSPELSMFCAVASTGTTNQRVMITSQSYCLPTTKSITTTVNSKKQSYFTQFASGTSYTNKTQQILLPSNSFNISNIRANINGTSNVGNTRYTFGKNIPTRLVAVGAGTNTIAYSNDGINWTGLGISIFSDYGVGVAWNGSLWVAVGSGNNSIATSPDGINWTGRGVSIFSNASDVVWNGSIWVVVGEGATPGISIATSPDGINWTTRDSNIFGTGNNTAYGIAWNGSIFVAVGFAITTTNTIATSPDGIKWTGRGASALTSKGISVAWNGSLFVAVGEATNTIATSTDGIIWTTRGDSESSFSTTSVAWNGSLWVATSIN